MKSLAKLRKQQFEQDVRDAKAFSVILWFILKALSGAPWKWAKKRLQRVYDAVLELMYSNRDNGAIGHDLEEWAKEMGLTEEAFFERKVAKAHGNHKQTGIGSD